jgi:mRNA interferase MazF
MRSAISTVIAVVLTSSMRLLDAPGNSLVTRKMSGLPSDVVANVSQLVTLDRVEMIERVGRLFVAAMRRAEAGLRLVLNLDGGSP